MNKDVLEFIAEYKLNPQHFFDANGQTLTSDVRDQMRNEEKIFAFNTSACNKGHNIKSRSGHCIVCEPKNIHFTLINFNESILNTFSKTNLTYNELKDLFDGILEKENKKTEISMHKYNNYGNSKRFFEAYFFIHTEKTRFDINLRIYTTGEVYFYF